MNELTIHLRRAQDLLAPDPTGLLDPDGDDARTAPGVDDLLAELLARLRAMLRRSVSLMWRAVSASISSSAGPRPSLPQPCPAISARCTIRSA